MNLDDYVFPDPVRPRWLVEHQYSSGSSAEGTRRHYYHAVPLTWAVLARNVGRLYDTREEAATAAARATERNEEP